MLHDNFEELDFGCNFSFHVISLSVSCNLLQMLTLLHMPCI
jgi:hypothetical protein